MHPCRYYTSYQLFPSTPATLRMEKQNDLRIPHEYHDLLEFITENKQAILKDKNIMKKIIVGLDQLLQDGAGLKELRQNTTIMLSTVRLQQDALVREYRREMTLSCLVEMANQGDLDEFFREAHSRARTVSFVDHLVFEYKPRERKQPAERIKYGTATERPRIPTIASHFAEMPESITVIEGIKQTIDKNGPTGYLKMIVDPLSYSKTVQNAFNIALAIRMKAISLVLSDETLFVCKYIPRELKSAHSVLEISPAKYRELLESLQSRNA